MKVEACCKKVLAVNHHLICGVCGLDWKYGSSNKTELLDLICESCGCRLGSHIAAYSLWWEPKSQNLRACTGCQNCYGMKYTETEDSVVDYVVPAPQGKYICEHSGCCELSQKARRATWMRVKHKLREYEEHTMATNYACDLHKNELYDEGDQPKESSLVVGMTLTLKSSKLNVKILKINGPIVTIQLNKIEREISESELMKEVKA